MTRRFSGHMLGAAGCAALALGLAGAAIPAGAEQPAAASHRSAALAPGQIFAVRHQEREGDGPRFEERIWRGTDGAGRRLWLRDGVVQRNAPVAADAPVADGLGCDEVLALPTESGALAERLRQIAGAPQPVLDAPGGKPTGRTISVPVGSREIVILAAGILDSNRPVPTRLRRALIHVIAHTADVRALGATRDALNRRGVAFAIDGDEAHEFYGRAVIVDPGRAELLGTFDYRRGNVSDVAGSSTRQVSIANSRPGSAR